MKSRLGDIDPRIIAARAKFTLEIGLQEEAPVPVKELLAKPEQAATYLSRVCMSIFEGGSRLTTTARDLDYFAYGLEIEKRSSQITKAIIKEIGEQQAGDLAEPAEED